VRCAGEKNRKYRSVSSTALAANRMMTLRRSMMGNIVSESHPAHHTPVTIRTLAESSDARQKARILIKLLYWSALNGNQERISAKQICREATNVRIAAWVDYATDPERRLNWVCQGRASRYGHQEAIIGLSSKYRHHAARRRTLEGDFLLGIGNPILSRNKII